MFDIERAMRVLEARRNGQTLQEIGDRYGFSKERARQLCKLALQIEEQQNSKNPWFELSPRTRNALSKYAYEQIKTARRNDPTKLYKDFSPSIEGVLEFYPTLKALKPVPALGQGSIRELEAWFIRHGKTALKYR